MPNSLFFDIFMPNMENAQKHTNIFIFYNEEYGEAYSKDLHEHFPQVLKDKAIIFDIGKITPGQPVWKKCDDALQKADVIILLIDAKLLNHSYYINEITPHLLKNEGKLLVQPILMRSCPYKYDAYLKKQQGYMAQKFPKGLLEMPKGKRGGIYTDIVNEIVVHTLEKKTSTKNETPKPNKPETKTEKEPVKEEKSTKKAVFTLIAVLTIFLVGYLFSF